MSNWSIVGIIGIITVICCLIIGRLTGNRKRVSIGGAGALLSAGGFGYAIAYLVRKGLTGPYLTVAVLVGIIVPVLIFLILYNLAKEMPVKGRSVPSDMKDRQRNSLEMAKLQEEMNRQRNSLETERAKLQEEINRQRLQIEAERTDMAQAAAEEKRKLLLILLKEKKKLEREREEMDQTAATADGAVPKKLEEHIKLFQKNKEKLIKEQENLNKQKEIFEKEQVNIQEKKDSLEQVKAYLEERQKSLAQERDNLEKGKRSLAQERDRLEEEKNSLKKEKEDIEKEKEALTENSCHLDENLGKLEEEKEELNQSVHSLKISLKELKEENQELCIQKEHVGKQFQLEKEELLEHYEGQLKLLADELAKEREKKLNALEKLDEMEASINQKKIEEEKRRKEAADIRSRTDRKIDYENVIEKGKALQKKGLYQLALTLYEEYYEKVQDESQKHLLLKEIAGCYMDMGEPGKAKRLLAKG